MPVLTVIIPKIIDVITCIFTIIQPGNSFKENGTKNIKNIIQMWSQNKHRFHVGLLEGRNDT